jgi:hypothetical protein
MRKSILAGVAYFGCRVRGGLCARGAVSIADDRIWAGSELIDQSLGEEALKMGSQRMSLHRVRPSSNERSARFKASCINSGTASMYQ